MKRMNIDDAKRLIREVIGCDDPVELTTTFADLGVDELDVVEIEFSVEDEFDVELPVEWYSDDATVGQLIDKVNELIA